MRSAAAAVTAQGGVAKPHRELSLVPIQAVHAFDRNRNSSCKRRRSRYSVSVVVVLLSFPVTAAIEELNTFKNILHQLLAGSKSII